MYSSVRLAVATIACVTICVYLGLLKLTQGNFNKHKHFLYASNELKPF